MVARAAPSGRSEKPGHWGVSVALAVTLAIGLWLRWALTGHVSIRGDFANLRHAHSHLGYFGVLFPLAWAAWGRTGAPVPSARLRAVYALATAVACVGFVRAGYGPEAIAGSSVVGVVWLASVWPLWPRLRDLYDPLAVVPLGVVGAMACLPSIAKNVDSAPVVSQAYVATFLAALLLGVIVPSVIATEARLRTPWPMLAVGAGASAAALGAYPTLATRGGLLLFAVILFRYAWYDERVHLRLAWLAVTVGLAGIAVGALPNTRPVAVGAVHFLILGPVLISLCPPRLRERVSDSGWWVYLGGVALLSGPLVLQGLGAGGWTLVTSALGGTGVAAWWLVVGVDWVRAPHEAAARPSSSGSVPGAGSAPTSESQPNEAQPADDAQGP